MIVVVGLERASRIRLLSAATRCELGSNPGRDRFHFALGASRPRERLTVLSDVNRKVTLDYFTAEQRDVHNTVNETSVRLCGPRCRPSDRGDVRYF